MNSSCPCGSAISVPSQHLGCVECGAACCPTCSYQLESASYCPSCAEAILELPWTSRPAGSMATSI